MGIFREPRRSRRLDRVTGRLVAPGLRLPDGPAADLLEDLLPRRVEQDRLIDWCAAQQYHYFVDSDGDLGGLWNNRLFYFLLFGEHEEILQVRARWNREISIDRLEEIIDACNEWNADRIWPKAYVRVRDNGAVHVLCESAHDLEHGATDAQLERLLSCAVATCTIFLDAIDELYPDPAAAPA